MLVSSGFLIPLIARVLPKIICIIIIIIIASGYSSTMQLIIILHRFSELSLLKFLIQIIQLRRLRFNGLIIYRKSFPLEIKHLVSKLNKLKFFIIDR